MVHCAVAVQESWPCGKAGTVLLQLRPPAGVHVGWPRSIVTPKVLPPTGAHVCPAGTAGTNVLQAPDGSTAMLPAEPFWGPLSMNALAKNVVYMTLDPPRSTVVPLPVTSQAKPTRGEKSL